LFIWLADIHQPLHNVDDNDAGGNGKVVKFFALQVFNGGPPNLHQVWDEGIIERDGKTVAQLIESLGKDGNDVTTIIAVTNPITWVQDAHKLAQDAYQRLPEPNSDDVFVLDENYFNAGLPVVTGQLRKAGLRLGRVLEKALGQ
jgi:hypothetical protein